jgi:succinate dehydrogenase / fumarate reductase cytochrome b subunit
MEKANVKTLPHSLGIRGWIWAGRYGLERWAYLCHRITGLALVLYLPLHLLVTGLRLLGPGPWEAFVRFSHHPVVLFFEWALMVAFLYHAINGFRLILTELFGLTIGKPAHPHIPPHTSLKRQKPFNIVLMVLGGIFIVLSVLDFFVWR